MPGHQHLGFKGLLMLLTIGPPGTQQAAVDLEEIVRRGSIAIQEDWAAAEDYGWIQKDETQKGERVTSRTCQVVRMAGSDYYMPIAIDGKPLPPDQQRSELEKLRAEFHRRNIEDAVARQRRIEKYRKERDENGGVLREFPKAFWFKLQGEESINGHPAYILSGTPRERTGPLSRAAKVLAGMRGTIWIDKETFHPIRAEADVIAPVPIYGLLARVLPGTHIAVEMEPVSESTWLLTELSMTLRVSKFFWFNSTQVTRSTYSDYRPNAQVIGELLRSAEQPN